MWVPSKSTSTGSCAPTCTMSASSPAPMLKRHTMRQVASWAVSPWPPAMKWARSSLVAQLFWYLRLQSNSTLSAGLVNTSRSARHWGVWSQSSHTCFCIEHRTVSSASLSSWQTHASTSLDRPLDNALRGNVKCNRSKSLCTPAPRTQAVSCRRYEQSMHKMRTCARIAVRGSRSLAAT